MYSYISIKLSGYKFKSDTITFHNPPQMVIIESFINLYVFMSNVISRIAVRDAMQRIDVQTYSKVIEWAKNRSVNMNTRQNVI